MSCFTNLIAEICSWCLKYDPEALNYLCQILQYPIILSS